MRPAAYIALALLLLLSTPTACSPLNGAAERAAEVCRLADGAEIRTLVDDTAATAERTKDLERARAYRRLGCAMLGGGITASGPTPVAADPPHDLPERTPFWGNKRGNISPAALSEAGLFHLDCEAYPLS